MLAWRFGLLAYLNAAIEANALTSDFGANEAARLLKAESQRPWNTFVGRKVFKRKGIDHIGRYIRKPPIAQYRLTRPSAEETLARIGVIFASRPLPLCS